MSDRFKAILENLLIVVGVFMVGLIIVAGIVIGLFSSCIEIIDGISFLFQLP